MTHVITVDGVASAWLAGLQYLLNTKERHAFNLILDISTPTAASEGDKNLIATVDAFLQSQGAGGISTVANTIFPASLYSKQGAEGVYVTYRLPPLVRSG